MKYICFALFIPVFGFTQSSSITIDTIGFTSRLNFDGQSYNILLGQNVGNINSTGLYNTFIGWENGHKNTSGQRNVTLGSYAGRNNTTGSGNVNLGLTAGTNNTTGSGNVNIGDGAGVLDYDGEYNVRIGFNAGSNAIGSNNVLLGNHAGFSLNADNKLIIANSNIGQPLIYGEFDNKILEVNGRVNVKGSLSIENTSQPDNLVDVGTIRWNPNSEDFEGYTGTKWKSLTDKDEKKYFGENVLAYESIYLKDDVKKSTSVAVSDDFIFVGKSNPGAVNIGYVNIYQNNQGVLTLHSQLKDSSHSGGEKYGASMDLKGNLLIVGAPEDGNGSAYIYRLTANSWNLENKITASGGSSGDQFGFCVGIHENWAIVGAPFYDSLTIQNRGAAYMFNWNGSQWVQTQKLKDKFPFTNYRFGYSVDIDGLVSVVGQPYEGDALQAGKVYSFNYSGGNWNREQAQGFASVDWNTGDNFGFAVSILNSELLVGAIGRDEYGSNSGAAYLYKRIVGGFNFVQKFLPKESGDNMNYGYSVSKNTNQLAIGGPGLEGNSGYGEVYELSNNCWNLEGVIKSSKSVPNSRFGEDISINTSILVVGSLGLNANIFLK